MAARIRLVIKTCVLTAFAVLIAAQTVEASSIGLRLSDGTTTVTIGDNMAGDINPLTGVIVFSGTIGDWLINTTTGVGEAQLIPGSMDLNSINISTAGTTTTLQIWLTMFDLNTVYPGFNLEFGGTTTNASVVYNALVSDPNLLFTGSVFASLGPFQGAFSGVASGLVSVTGPYSVTQHFAITGLAGTPVSFSGDAELNALPEPGSMVLLGTGLLAIAGIARRRVLARRRAT